MEMKLMGWSLIVFGLVVMVLNNACPANGITCQEALMTLMPCEPYLGGSLCECLKTAAAGMKIDPARLKAIPDYCKVSIPVPLDPSVDCSK
ncbi:unnamed protein product [Prunus armeniaca]|uniref:Bifunctional inhibitor/plant lipid transfer protein/seed storage helical domain-containing protein n=1 Tax=Prunus armeniaca TaxID=36596 RepID=A0A6J5X2X4_PRUAR|nr:unnamed protein product [Prunus armeniaca]